MVIRDIDNKLITKNFIYHESTLFLYSDEYFNIAVFENDTDLNGIELNESIIISDDQLKTNPELFEQPLIYQNINYPTDDTVIRGTSFQGKDSNNQYTIYLGKTPKQIKLIITSIKNINTDSNYIPDDYQITIDYRPINKLLDSQEHYNDLLTNYNLPSINELNSIIIDDRRKYDSIKKLLLEYRSINKHKGKLKSIEKFLNIIGFNPDSIKLYPEYITPNKVKTITPNKLTDSKTGYYHIIFNNWEYKGLSGNERYTPENLPNIKNVFQNYDDLFDRLISALTIAHKYFTIKEQKLSFFGINTMVNNPQYQSIASNMTITYYIDTIGFKKDIDIKVWNQSQIDSHNNVLIDKNIQKTIDLKFSEVKYYKQLPLNPIKENSMIFYVDREIRDNESSTNLTKEEQLNIRKEFGNILHLRINSKAVYYKYTLKNINNDLITIKSDLIRFDINKPNQLNTTELKILIKEFGEYKLLFEFFDYYGNRELFDYKFKFNSVNIDFQIFDTTKLIDDTDVDKFKLNQDISSPVKVSEQTPNRIEQILNVSDLPNTLLDDKFIQNYYDLIANNNLKLEYYSDTKHTMLPLLNKNNLVSKITETLPTKYIDNFLNIITLKKIDNWYYRFDNNLFVREMDIVTDQSNPKVTEKYWFICTKTNSVNINPNLYNITVLNSLGKRFDTIDIINNSLPDYFDYKNNIIPVNYDFELFDKPENLGKPDNIVINSVYPRMTKDNINFLKIGDIIVCKIDDNLATNYSNFVWTVINSFTNESIKTSTDYVLKFIVNENVLYDINLQLTINNKEFNLTKRGIKSSFKLD